MPSKDNEVDNIEKEKQFNEKYHMRIELLEKSDQKF